MMPSTQKQKKSPSLPTNPPPAAKKKTKATGNGNGSAADLSHIIEALRPLAVDINKIQTDPANARLHSPRNLQAIKGSLSKYGQRKPVVVNRLTHTVEAGNGTLDAARELGWNQVAVVYVEDDPTTATGYSISDNRTSELSEWDWESVAKQLRDLKAADINLLELGWEDYELEPLLQAEWKPPAINNDSDGGLVGPRVKPIELTQEERQLADEAFAAVRKRRGAGSLTDGQCFSVICREWLKKK